jgi:hypothetical protein
MIDIMPIDPEALAASLRRLASLWRTRNWRGGSAAACDRSLRDLFGVAGSGIMLADEQNIPRYVAASMGLAECSK